MARSCRNLSSYLGKLVLSFFLFFGCFFSVFSRNSSYQRPELAQPRACARLSKRKQLSVDSNISSFPSRFISRPKKVVSSSWSFVKRVFSSSSSSSSSPPPYSYSSCCCRPSSKKETEKITAVPLGLGLREKRKSTIGAIFDIDSCSNSSSSNSSSYFSSSDLFHSSDLSDSVEIPTVPGKRPATTTCKSRPEPEPDLSPQPGLPCYSNEYPVFPPLSNNIFPCPSCGEIFFRARHLDHHRSTRHAVSELRDGDDGNSVVRIIFSTGWPNDGRPAPYIHRVLKINHGDGTLARFEEYRESVKAKAAKGGPAAVSGCMMHYDQRCLVDGNEVLRFYCAAFLCGLGQIGGGTSICADRKCTACGIIGSGFSDRLMGGILTTGTSWGAHVKAEEEFGSFNFMMMTRAMLVCRVVAGRVGYEQEKDHLFDSVVVAAEEGGRETMAKTDEELLVFNPRAVLPCFVIVYSAIIDHLI